MLLEIVPMSNTKKQRARAIMAKTGMSYQAAINVLAKGGHPAAGAAARA